MNYVKLFEEFSSENKMKKKRLKKKKPSETSSFEPPEYLVQPAKDDKGFDLVKKHFNAMTKKFDTGFFSSGF
jgi:hypothetical protein